MIRKTSPLSQFLGVSVFAFGIAQPVMAEETHVYETGGKQYTYTLAEAGDNHTFEFKQNPGNGRERFKATMHMLQVVYADGSINPTYSEFFLKEGAKCYVYDGFLYTYRACFLPNDFSPGNEERFWGSLSRVPNGLWLVSRSLVPALALGGLFFYSLRRKPKIQARPADSLHTQSSNT